ncbi:MAG: glycoside hydrolase family 35 protein [Promethearchaeota archaeon]
MVGKRIIWDKYTLKVGVDEKRIIVIGAEFHYWRIPDRDRWYEVLKAYKSAGLNSIRIFFHWGFHSPSEGKYNFKENRDINYLLQLCEEIGLYVFVASGPYSCAESNAGGYPTWLLQKREIRIRHIKKTGYSKFDENYMKYCREWYEHLIPQLKEHQLTENSDGCIISFQIENEYSEKVPRSFIRGIPEYMEELKKYALELGITVPIFHNDMRMSSSWNGLVDLYAFDKYIILPGKKWRENPSEKWSTKGFIDRIDNIEETLQNFDPPANENPVFIAELQGGWFNHWTVSYGYDEIYDFYGSSFQKVLLQSVAAQRASMMILYMFYGGTNYGAIGSPEVYTSYDYSASIREYGYYSNRLNHIRLFTSFIKSFSDSFSRTEPAVLKISCSSDNFLYKQRISPEDGTDYYFFRNFNDKDVEEFSIALIDKKKEDGSFTEGTIVPKLGKHKLEKRNGFIAIGNHKIKGFKIKFCSLPIVVKSPYLDGTLLIVIQNGGELLLEGTGYKTEGYINSTEEEKFTRFSFVREGYDTVTSTDNEKLYIVCLSEESALTLNVKYPKDEENDIVVVWGPYASYFNKDGDLEIETLGNQEIRLISSAESVSNINNLMDIHVPGVKFGYFGKNPENIDFKNVQLVWSVIKTDWTSSIESNIWKEINFETEKDPLDHGFTSGHILYKCEFNPGSSEELNLNTEKPTIIELTLNTRHKAAVWLNGKFIGAQTNFNFGIGKIGAMYGDDPEKKGKKKFELNSSIKPGEINILFIITESLGQNKHFFPFDSCRNPRGILSAKLSEKNIKTKWYISGIDVTNPNVQDPYNTSGLPGEKFEYHLGKSGKWIELGTDKPQIAPEDQIIWLKSNFTWETPEETRIPLRVHLNGKFNANIFLNGKYIGRYWGEAGPQHDFYIMKGFLKSENVLVLACWTTVKEDISVSIKPYFIEKESGNISKEGTLFITKKHKIKL